MSRSIRSFARERLGRSWAKFWRVLNRNRCTSPKSTGKRTALLIVDVEKASQIPALAEPWFLNFNAGVRLHPVMSSDDLQRAGLAELGKKWG